MFAESRHASGRLEGSHVYMSQIRLHKKLIIFILCVRDESQHMVFCANYTVHPGDAETVYNKVREVLREEGTDAQIPDGASAVYE